MSVTPSCFTDSTRTCTVLPPLVMPGRRPIHSSARSKSLLLFPARVHGVALPLEPSVTTREPRVPLVKSHFRSRERRSDTLTRQRIVIGTCLLGRTVLAIRLGGRRGNFRPVDVAPMIVLVAVYPDLIRVLPQHPRTLGMDGGSDGEQ